MSFVKNTFFNYKDLLITKIKFGMSSSLASIVDFCIFTFFVKLIFIDPVHSNIISSSCGMIINFFLQKKFVFELNRNVILAFCLTIIVSIGGIFLGTMIIKGLCENINFFAQHELLGKLIAMGTVFFYNFYLKRFVFERKIRSVGTLIR